MKRDRTPDDEEEDDLPHAEEEEDEALEDEEEADAGDADADPGDAGDDDGGDLDLDAELERELAAGEAEAEAEEVKAGDRPASPTPREAMAEEPGDPGRPEPTPAPAARTASPEDAAAADAEAASRAAWAARTRALAAAMTDEQMDRYEAFRRATLARPAVKKVRGGKEGPRCWGVVSRSQPHVILTPSLSLSPPSVTAHPRDVRVHPQLVHRHRGGGRGQSVCGGASGGRCVWNDMERGRREGERGEGPFSLFSLPRSARVLTRSFLSLPSSHHSKPALEEAAKLGQTGPLRPAHVAAAFQRLEAEGRGLPCTAHPRRRVRL